MSDQQADPAMYARVFENGEGAVVLEDMVRRFGGRLFVPGGEDGKRMTDFKLGRRAVLDHIVSMIDRANGVEPADDESTTAG